MVSQMYAGRIEGRAVSVALWGRSSLDKPDLADQLAEGNLAVIARPALGMNGASARPTHPRGSCL